MEIKCENMLTSKCLPVNWTQVLPKSKTLDASSRIKVETKQHPLWGKDAKFAIVGKEQFLYSSTKGEISLIQLCTDKWFWEIYSLRGNLFEDVERFETKKDAIKRIEELL